MTRHSNHSLKIHSTLEGAAVTVGLISQLAHQLGTEVTAPDTGDPYEVAQVITRQMPSLPYQTHSLKSILDLVGLSGKCIAADGSHPGVVAYAQKHDACGTAGRASSNHMSVTYAAGHLVNQTLAGSVGSDAMLTGCMHGKATAASTAPYVVAFNASLPASPTNDERYSIGNPTVLGVEVNRCRSVSINFDPALILSEDGDSIWPTLVDIEKIKTLTTIVTEDPGWLNDTGRVAPTGDRGTHSDTKLYWLRREVTGTPVSGGTFKDYAGSVHIEMTLAGLVYISEHYNASGSGVSQTQIQIAGIESGGTAPIVWDTTAAYPN